MDRCCEACNRPFEPGEPFTSFDFVTQRDAGDHVHVLEGRELFTCCIPCGYERLGAVSAALLGLSLEDYQDLVGSAATAGMSDRD